MLSWLPSLAYPPAGDGYWSPITSTLNWCEEARSKPWAFTKHRNNHSQDYYATPYVAEIVNTLTNSFFVYLGAKGIYNTLKEGHEKIFLTTFCGYLLVGTGSIFFHMTLKCMTFLSEPSDAQLMNFHRSVAAGGRAIHDLHDLHHVLRNLQSQANYHLRSCARGCAFSPIRADYHVLPLPPRPDLPPDFLCYSDRCCLTPSHVGHGSKHSTIHICERKGIERER